MRLLPYLLIAAALAVIIAYLYDAMNQMTAGAYYDR